MFLLLLVHIVSVIETMCDFGCFVSTNKAAKHENTLWSCVTAGLDPTSLLQSSCLLFSSGCSSTVAGCPRCPGWCQSSTRGWQCLWCGGSNLCRSSCWRATLRFFPPATATSRDVSCCAPPDTSSWRFFWSQLLDALKMRQWNSKCSWQQTIKETSWPKIK